MSATGFRYEPYPWRGQSELMLVHGSNEGPQAIIIPPLFEEMNFTRGFVVDMARALAAQGIGSWLPDLPGTGESPRGLGDLGWDDWRDAARMAGETVATRTGRKPHVAALRGGALLGSAIEGRSWWNFAPASGASLLRDLQRTRLLSNQLQDDDIEGDIREYIGYPLSPAMHQGLAEAEPALVGRHRNVPDGLRGKGAPLWRRVEPGRDRALSHALAADIAGWIAECERR